MRTPFTFAHFATVLFLLSLSTESMLAQPSTSRTVPVKQPAPALKSQRTSPAAVRTSGNRPAVTTKVTSVSAPSATTQSTSAVASPQTKVADTGANQPTSSIRPQPAKPTDARINPSPDGGRNKYLNVGVGLAAYYGGGLPLGASFEVDVKDNISVGGSVDYMRYGYNSGGYKWNYTFIYAGARASYHLADILSIDDNKFDPYGGATLGLRYAGYTDNYGYDNYVSPYNSGLYLGIHVGARYLFTEKLGGFAEVGYGVSALRLGLSAKF